MRVWKKLDNLLYKNPAKTVGVLGVMADAASALSGLAFDNIGRLASGALGAPANLSLVFFSGKKRKEGEIDPQDLPFRQKIKHIWKFWKYPFEFASAMNLMQSLALGVLSGPDTVIANRRGDRHGSSSFARYSTVF